MKRITCVILLVGALACTESNNKEEKDQTDRGRGVKHKKELKRYHANQTDQKKDGILVRDSSSNEPWAFGGVVLKKFIKNESSVRKLNITMAEL